jgi:drug/metabolite transporter (DMT)-like permease
MKPWVLFLLGLILFESLADIFAKEFSIHNRPWLAVVAIMLYVLANSSWLLSLRNQSTLAISANIFSIASGLIALLIGVYMYGEILSNKQLLGVVLGLVSLALMF